MFGLLSIALIVPGILAVAAISTQRGSVPSSIKMLWQTSFFAALVLSVLVGYLVRTGSIDKQAMVNIAGALVYFLSFLQVPDVLASTNGGAMLLSNLAVMAWMFAAVVALPWHFWPQSRAPTRG